MQEKKIKESQKTKIKNLGHSMFVKALEKSLKRFYDHSNVVKTFKRHNLTICIGSSLVCL